MKQENESLEWIDLISRNDIHNHPQIKNSKSLSDQSIFIKKCTILEQDYEKFSIKQSLGYYTVDDIKLHPTLKIEVILAIKQYELLKRLAAVIERHSNYPFRYMQKIYHVSNQRFQSYCSLRLICDTYKFNLEDLITIKQRQAKLLEPAPLKLVQFLRTSLLLIYLSILDVLLEPSSPNKPNTDQLNLSFNLQPKNILFDKNYQVMLGNLFYGSRHQDPILAFINQKNEKFFKKIVCQNMKECLKNIFKIGNLDYTQDISYKFFHRKKEDFIKAEDERKQLLYMMQKLLVCSEFPNEDALKYLRKAEGIIASGKEMTLYQIKQLQKKKDYLCNETRRYQQQQ